MSKRAKMISFGIGFGPGLRFFRILGHFFAIFSDKNAAVV